MRDIKTAEAMFHDAIKGFLGKREQGLVMGHFRAVLEAAPASSAMPKLTLALPDYEKRRIVIASDEMLDDDEYLVCVAIDAGKV